MYMKRRITHQSDRQFHNTATHAYINAHHTQSIQVKQIIRLYVCYSLEVDLQLALELIAETGILVLLYLVLEGYSLSSGL